MRTLTNKQIAHIMDIHSMTWYIENGHIYGLIYYTSRNGRHGEVKTDLTGYTVNQMRDYLNY